MAAIKGRWSWQGIVENTLERYTETVATINFSSNNKDFSSLIIRVFAIPTIVEVFYNDIQVQRCYLNDSGDENADGDYEEEAELNEAYRVMDFGEVEQEIDEEIYNFIVKNAEFIPVPIAEKLVRIAENVERVYQAGVKDGKDAGGYTEGYTEGYTNGHGKAVGEVAELNAKLEQTLYGTDTGGKSYYDEFWDALQDGGKRNDYNWAFSNWGSEYIRPKYKVIPTVSSGATDIVYSNAVIKKIESAYFDLSQIPPENTTHHYAFAGCDNLEEIEDIGFMPASYYMWTFAWSIKLKTIAKITSDENTVFNNTFAGCYSLENITFAGVIGQSISFSHCSKLSEESMRNIVEHLSDTASGMTLTLSQTAVNNAFTTDEWNALVATKSNWTFSLV